MMRDVATAAAPPSGRPRSSRAGAAAVPFALAGLGVALGWSATSPTLSMGMNWDTAGYAADFASGRARWSAEPWSSHYALGSLYWVAMRAAGALGGTALDGVRGLTAAALGASAALVYGGARAVGAARALGAAAALVFASAWGILLLAFTWEDNLLYLPFGLAALRLSIARAEAWRARDSVFAGTLVGAGTLLSWQAGLYAFPPLYAALVLGGARRGWGPRARDGGLVLAALLGARLGWVFFFWLTGGGPTIGRLLGIAFSRPTPSFFPDGLGGWWDLLRQRRTVLRHLGHGIAHELGPAARDAVGLGARASALGAAALALGVALWVGVAWRARRVAVHLLGATLLAFILGAAIYLDLPIDKYKRYEFFPVLAPLLLVALLSDPFRPAARQAITIIGLAGLLATAGGQLAASFAWNRAHHRRLPPPAAIGYEGRDGQTWFAYMRRLHAKTPGACRHVFTFEELAHARFQLEIPAALHSELRTPVVLGDPSAVRTWVRPLPVVAIDDYRASARPCDWRSAAAQALLAR